MPAAQEPEEKCRDTRTARCATQLRALRHDQNLQDYG
ncbi:hypothetical protein A2U01_0114226, partial [Trifolium medium]|nr:hypothetical protein [Trifolium medium]